jgi:TRAP-type C4-dicarboxylate transport system substrate-binding protein
MKIKSLVIALSLAAGFVGMSSAQVTMRSSISIAENSHQGIGLVVFAREVEARTNGRYKIQNFYASALGGEREATEAVQLGTQELT